MIALVTAPGLNRGNTVTYDCSTTDAWLAIDSSLEPASDAQMTATDGQLVFEYPREQVRMLAHYGVELRGLEKLTLRVRSNEEIMFRGPSETGTRRHSMPCARFCRTNG